MERLFALWNQAMQKPWIAKCWQFIKFGIVGVSNTLISLAVYQLALNALGLHYLAANALGLDSLLLVFWMEAIGIPEALAPVLNLCITIPLNFFINKYWTFRR